MSEAISVSRLTKHDGWNIALLCALTLFFIFYRIGAPQLFDWDEALYASIAAEMKTTGDWAVLHLQGKPWLEKEPLPFWLMGVSYTLFGMSEFAVRFPSAIIGLVMMPAFYALARFWVGKWAAFILSLIFFFSPPLWDAHSTIRSGDLDSMALTFFLATLALYLYTRTHRRFWWLPALPIALCVLTRGVMGLLPLVLVVGAEVARAWWQADRWEYKKMALLAAGALAPWLVWQLFMISAFGGEFIDVYWGEQFSTRITHSLQGHAGPFSFYWKFLLAKFGVLFWVLAFGVLWLVYDFILQLKYRQALLLAWLALTLIPPHLMETKLYWYILPAVAPLLLSAWLLVRALYRLLVTPQKKAITTPLYTWFFVVFVLCAVAVIAQWPYRLARGIHTSRQGPLQELSALAAQAGIQHTNMVVYNTDQWNFGRVMPRLYWYGHVQNKWNLISVGRPNIEFYLANSSEYPIWLTRKDDREELTGIVGEKFITTLLETDTHVIIKNTLPTS